MNSDQHNLDIDSYHINDIYGLFDMDVFRSTENDLKQAKRKMQNTHPDKSRLDPKYFVFYKKAYHVLESHYMSTHLAEFSEGLMTKGLHNGYAYDPHYNVETVASGHAIPSRWNQDEMHQKNQQFNELFEQNYEKKIHRDNSWFSSTPSSTNPSGQGQSNRDLMASVNQRRNDIPSIGTANMGAPNDKNLREYRRQQRENNQLMVYRGFQEMSSNGGGSYFHDDDAEERERHEYVSSGDPFAKLKFDDIRKVYKDETVFTVDESQYEEMPKYNSVKDYENMRGQALHQPKTRQELEREEWQRQYDAERLKKLAVDYKSAEWKKQQANEKKTQSFLSSFLRLGN